MNRIFFRIFPLILLAIAVAAVSIYFVIRYAFGDPLEDIARRQAAGPIFLLEQYIDLAPADEWLARLNKVREVSNFHLDLIPLEDAANGIDAGKREALKRGEIVLDIGSKTLFRRVDLAGERYIGSADEVLRVSNLPIDLGFELKMEAIRYLIVALCVLVPIGLWSRAHWLSLQSLSRVADRFGEGNLSTRAEASARSGVYPLALCMNRMADRIEGLLDAHKSLLHSVSHELRTPISRLGFGLELLRDAPSPEKAEARIASMEEDLRELNALVNELLELAKPDQAQSRRNEAFLLANALHEAAGRLEHAFVGKQLSLNIAADLGEFIGDPRLIRRAVSNLLANAAKYAEHSIALSASAGGTHVEIAVEDDGPGIPADERERIFDPFYRLDRSRDRATGGFGLGLAIVRKAVLLHGGDVSVHESALGGARFVMRLPAGDGNRSPS